MVGCFDEYVLNVCSHFWIAQNFIAFVDHEKFAFFEIDEFVFCKIVETTGCGNDDMGCFVGVFEILLVFFEGHPAKITPDT
jgi:hypothetical protein